TVSVLADAGRIAQVLMNYLTNALKYSAEDRPVSVSVSLEEAQRVRVAVRDEGPGLSSQEQERIWKRFQQIERIKSRGSYGVGLGLWVLAIAILFCLHITLRLIDALLYSLLCLHARSSVRGCALTSIKHTCCRLAST